MILYHPATDFYHCWLRFSSLLSDDFDRPFEYDRLRIIDFFLCFPHEIEKCRIPAEYNTELRRLVRSIPKGYEDRLSVRQAFKQMSSIQRHVAMDMVARGLIEKSSYQAGAIVPSSNQKGRQLLLNVANGFEMRSSNWYKALIDSIGNIHLNGENGLKHRTGLLEFRYDE
jgi:hypothetical protein